jgi:hypothetical protein
LLKFHRLFSVKFLLSILASLASPVRSRARVTVNGRLIVTLDKVGSAATVAGLGLVSMTIGAARNEIMEGLLVSILADWNIGEVDLHAAFPVLKAAKP